MGNHGLFVSRIVCAAVINNYVFLPPSSAAAMRFPSPKLLLIMGLAMAMGFVASCLISMLLEMVLSLAPAPALSC